MTILTVNKFNLINKAKKCLEISEDGANWSINADALNEFINFTYWYQAEKCGYDKYNQEVAKKIVEDALKVRIKEWNKK